MRKRFSQTKEYMVVVALFVLLVNVTLGIIMTRQSGNAMKDLIKGRMLDISNTAADMIDGDVLRDLTAKDANTAGYRTILKTLTYYQDNIDLKYIYCIRDVGNRKFIFTVDPTVKDPAVFGDSVVYTDALYEASLGHASVDSEPYTDEWGRFYSAYSPVFDSQGEVAGIVAVDFAADWYDRQVHGLIRTMIIITILSLSFGLVIVLMITSRSKKRYRLLMEELNNLSNGIETLSIELSEGLRLEGTELLHNVPDRITSDQDEEAAIGNKIRSLQKYLSLQIENVRAKAYRDGLTGLGNRTAYIEYITYLNSQIENQTASFSVAMFDINGLKDINDQEGHDKGDYEIIRAATILKEAFSGERIFRIGGDEFVVILGYTGEMAKRAVKKYEKYIADANDEDSNHLIMSSGFAEFYASSDKTYQDTFDRADRLMYEHKKAYYETHDDRRGGRTK